MASQVLTIAKICGESAGFVHQRFCKWHQLRSVGEDPNEWSPQQWPETVHEAANNWADSIREHCHQLPIFFFSEYVDMWSFCPPIRYLGHHQLYGVYTNRYELFSLQLPTNILIDEMSKLQKEGQHEEDRLFGQLILNAVCAWTELVSDAGTLVMIRRVVSGAVEDSEIEASLLEIPEWL